MFPKSKNGEKVHRRKKRNIEISLNIEILSRFFNNNWNLETNNITILEFGSGDGFQIPHLKKLGKLVASDIYTSKDIKDIKDASFVQCNINNAPFKDGQFSLIYSNHVIEHLKDKKTAFDELKRIGKSNCIYAFSVPTNIWLLLSIPAQYYNMIRSISKRMLNIRSKETTREYHKDDRLDLGKNKNKADGIIKLFKMIIPTGHGSNHKFISCYSSFRIKNWSRLFIDNGLFILEKQPLLLYGPSEWPIIPTTKLFNRFNISSSVLFVLKKAGLKRNNL